MVLAEQLCLLGVLIALQNIFLQQYMEFCRVLPVLRKITQFVTVAKIELLKSAPSHDAVDAPAEIVVCRHPVILPQPLLSYRRIILVDAPFYSLAGVVLAKLMDSDRLLPPRRRDRPVLALRIEAVVVSSFPEF